MVTKNLNQGCWLTELRDLAIRFSVEGFDPLVAHFWANDALAAGWCSAGLRTLASADVRNGREMRSHFEAILRESAIATPTGQNIPLAYMRYLARAALAEEIDHQSAVRRFVAVADQNEWNNEHVAAMRQHLNASMRPAGVGLDRWRALMVDVLSGDLGQGG
ncbi:hypothetical protein [Kineococcus sp. NPDC059986]|jgi:hypothetical protein|uniref:hypothetical protein n=1 Tax=Kineococcus sp. NPDC059986 TaxID=3155538 RepID=UPI00344EA656